MKQVLKNSIRELALHYFEEVARDPESKDITVLQTYADNYIRDIERYLSAYNDFKEE